MRIVYTDENPRLKDLADLVNSNQLRAFVNENIRYTHRYLRGTDRVLPDLTRNLLNDFLKQSGFSITDECDHLHGLCNNNAYYVMDKQTDDYIGFLHLNDDMFGYLYCFASDFKRLPVSDIYCISPTRMTRDRGVDVDWSVYNFEKNSYAPIDQLLSDATHLSQSAAPGTRDNSHFEKEK